MGNHRNVWFRDDSSEARLEFFLGDGSWTIAEISAVFDSLESEGWQGLRLNYSSPDRDGDGGMWITAGRPPTDDDLRAIDTKREEELSRHRREAEWHLSQIEKLGQ